jgi:hypothetical protein
MFCTQRDGNGDYNPEKDALSQCLSTQPFLADWTDPTVGHSTFADM